MQSFKFFWIAANSLNFGISAYYIFFKLKLTSLHPDNLEYTDQRMLLHILLFQLLLWGSSLVWAESYFLVMLITPLLYFYVSYYSKKEYIGKKEIHLINFIVLLWLTLLLIKIGTGRNSLTFEEYSYIFLFQDKPLSF